MSSTLANFRRELAALSPDSLASAIIWDYRKRDSNGPRGTDEFVNEPQCFGALPDAYLTSSGGWSLPDDRAVFLLRASAKDMLRLLSDGRESAFLATSWSELLLTHAEVAAHVLHAAVEHPTLSGGTTPMRMALADVPPGAEVSSVWAPEVLVEEDGQRGVEPESRWRALIPMPISLVGMADAADPTALHTFFLDGVAFDLELGASGLDLAPGVKWWTPVEYPGRAEHLQAFIASGADGVADERMLTGVLTIEHGPEARTESEKRADFEDATTRVSRLCVLLNTLYGCLPHIVARASIFSRTPTSESGSRDILMGIPWRHWQAHRFEHVPRRIPPGQALEAAKVAFARPPKKGQSLLEASVRAADALVAARSIRDSASSHVLLWSAIEALLSEKEPGLISTVTLRLLGLQAPVPDAVAFWRDSKRSYDARSAIAHGNTLPRAESIAAASAFADCQLRILMRHVLRKLKDGETSRDAMRDELLHRTLRATQHLDAL